MSAGNKTFKVIFSYKDPSGTGTASGTQKISHVKDDEHARRVFKLKYADRYKDAKVTRVTPVKASVDDSVASKVVSTLLREDEEEVWPNPLSRDVMIDVLSELDFSFNDYKTVDEVSEYREKLGLHSDETLVELLSTALDTEATADAVRTALIDQYPDGTILSDNSPFHH